MGVVFFTPPWEPAAMGRNLVVGVMWQEWQTLTRSNAVSHRRGRGPVRSTGGVAAPRANSVYRVSVPNGNAGPLDRYSSYKGEPSSVSRRATARRDASPYPLADRLQFVGRGAPTRTCKLAKMGDFRR